MRFSDILMRLKARFITRARLAELPEASTACDQCPIGAAFPADSQSLRQAGPVRGRCAINGVESSQCKVEIRDCEFQLALS